MLCLLALCHLIGVGAAITTTYFASQSALLTDSFATEHNGDRYAHYDMVRCIICSQIFQPIVFSLLILFTRRLLNPSTPWTRPFK